MISTVEVVWAVFAFLAFCANGAAALDAHADVRAMEYLHVNGARKEVNRAARTNALQLMSVQLIFFSIALVAFTAPEPVRESLQFYNLYAAGGLLAGEFILAINGIWTMVARRRSLLALVIRRQKGRKREEA